MARWREDYAAQQEEIKTLQQEIKQKARQVAHNNPPKDGDKFWVGFKKGRLSNAISRRVQSAEERLKRIEDDPIPKPPDAIQFDVDFDPEKLRMHTPLSVMGLTKRYDGRTILNGVSFTLHARSRVVIVGENGVGKSTLLRMLAGQETPDAGEVWFNPQVNVGYLDQEAAHLDPNLTAFEAYRAGIEGDEQRFKSLLLGSDLFRYEEIGRKVHTLSSGQKRKLQIARFIIQKPNFLILDEPTNYISFDLLEIFEAALRDFAGPIVAASHDRRFIEQFLQGGGEIWELGEGELTEAQERGPSPLRQRDGDGGFA
jgi:macrolide transport system ATP-binding/permease protein